MVLPEYLIRTLRNSVALFGTLGIAAIIPGYRSEHTSDPLIRSSLWGFSQLSSFRTGPRGAPMTLVKRNRGRNHRPYDLPSARPPLRELSGAERLTGLGFRYWLHGYQGGQLTCWEDAWNLYACELGPEVARVAIRDLSSWVRQVSGHAQRPIRLCPAGSERFGYDECLAVSMIAAAQHDCPAIKACAYALLGAQPQDDVLLSATRFAACLGDNSMILSPSPLVDPLDAPAIPSMGCC